MRSRDIQDVAKPKIKKGWRQENHYSWLAYIFRRSALALFKSNFFLYLQGEGGGDWKILAFLDFFTGIIFPIATFKNISRVFNFANSTKIRENREN